MHYSPEEALTSYAEPSEDQSEEILTETLTVVDQSEITLTQQTPNQAMKGILDSQIQ